MVAGDFSGRSSSRSIKFAASARSSAVFSNVPSKSIMITFTGSGISIFLTDDWAVLKF